MLTEGDVIHRVITFFEKNGYKIVDQKNTSQQGYDIVAEKEGKRTYIEAKGQTSSKPHSNRYGKEFTSNQKWDHVSKAVYTAMKTLKKEGNCDAGIALPADDVHMRLINDIYPSLQALKIEVYLVHESGIVQMYSP